MKTDPALPTVPIVVCTSTPGVEVPGAVAVPGKPLCFERLLAAIEEHGADRSAPT